MTRTFIAGQDQLDEINLWLGDSQTLVNAIEMIPNPFLSAVGSLTLFVLSECLLCWWTASHGLGPAGPWRPHEP